MRFHTGLLTIALLLSPASPSGRETFDSLPRNETGQRASLSGHVLPALDRAIKLPPAQYAAMARDSAPLSRDSTLTLTIVLNRDDPEGFGRFVREVQDPGSPNFRRFASQEELARRFGPTREAYDRVLAFLEGSGFALVEGSANRLTLTARGTRAQGERAFGVRIDDYRMHGRSFFANDRDPVLPSALAPHVQAVIGLSNLARPRPNIEGLRELCHVVTGKPWALCWPLPPPGFPHFPEPPAPPPPPADPYDGPPDDEDEAESQSLRLSGATTAAAPLGAPRWLGVRGTGQTIGLLQFDTFKPSDVADWLAFTRLPADRISRLSQVHVNGGAPAGANQAEVLLDIAAVMTFAPAAHYVVYDAPFSGSGTSFQSLFNAMINGGVTVISNSWAYCEDQTTLADVTSIDSILAAAAASGIGVFNASGDTGSTCLDGSPDTVAVPASSPNGTAVGGTSLTVGPGFTYGGETYWNGTTATPPTGQGGFGLSRFFGRPAYQDGLNGSPKRSVPDVAVNADPARGIPLCQADAGGCPNGLSYGGTSVAAPIWAAFAALLNEAQGQNLGNLNPLLYPLANTPAFHTPASMGSDFQRVGLGSPNLNRIHLALLGRSAGPVDPNVSDVLAESNAVPAEGATETFVVVRLRDVQGNSVSGKTVALSASAGAGAVISPPSSVSTVANGAVVFTVKSTTAERVTFTATDVTDGIMLRDQPVVEFTNPPAVAAGLSPPTQSVLANGVASGTLTVTLKDALGRGAVGKTVSLSQGNGHSFITGPVPAVTDSSGQVSFSITSRTTEMVTYRAFDVTDGNLEVPVTAAINFVNGIGAGCPLGVATAAPGYSVSSFATGFPLSLFAGQCRGPTGLAFDSSGNLLVMGFGDGVLYKFGSNGGVASVGTRVSTLPLPSASCPYSLAWSKDGQHLYLARQFCGGSGDVVELNPATGQITRTVASGIVCADGMATDPVTGDLFVAAPCPAAPASVVRISNPQGASPTVSTYSTPGHCDTLTFGPDGTLYSMCYPGDGVFRVTRIAGTSSATPGAFTYLAALGTVPADGIVIASNPGDPGHPPYVIVNKSDGNIVKVDLTKSPPVVESVATGGSVGDIMVAGPDGCGYAVQSDRVLRIANADGTCPFAPSSAIAQLSLSPSSVLPDPAQGSAQTFTARLLNASPAPDTRVTFVVTGANPNLKLVRIGSDGTASFTHVAAHTGTDSVVATTTSGTGPLTSNTAEVTWTAGKHVTFLTLNPSPTTGMPDAALTVTAALADVSQDPPAKVSGAVINFTVAGASCVGVTDANGLASCNLTPAGSPGNKTLTAAFGGNAQYTAATASTAFVLVASNESGLSGVGPAHVWVGLKNSDDVGTQFDLQVKVLIGNTVVAQGQTLCVTGLVRNPDKPKQVVVPLALVGAGGGAGDDVLRVRVSTRVGTTPQGARCPGPGGSHASARGLRLYYDGAKTPSSLGLQLAPDALDDFYLDSNGGICANLPSPTATTFSLDETAPGAAAPKCRDSGTVNFANGNPWQLIGTWSLPVP